MSRINKNPKNVIKAADFCWDFLKGKTVTNPIITRLGQVGSSHRKSRNAHRCLRCPRCLRGGLLGRPGPPPPPDAGCCGATRCLCLRAHGRCPPSQLLPICPHRRELSRGTWAPTRMGAPQRPCAQRVVGSIHSRCGQSSAAGNAGRGLCLQSRRLVGKEQ